MTPFTLERMMSSLVSVALVPPLRNMILNNAILDMIPEWQKYPLREDKRPAIMSLITMIKAKSNRFVVASGDTKVYKLASDEQIYN